MILEIPAYNIVETRNKRRDLRDGSPGAFSLVFFAELIFTYAAQRTRKVFGKIFPLCAGGNAVIGIADGFVIDISANIANIFHFIFSSHELSIPQGVDFLFSALS